LRADWYLVLSTVSLVSCVLCFAFTSYYLYKIHLELAGRFPEKSVKLWALFWLSPFEPILHARAFPESPTRRKLGFCVVGVIVFGYIGFAAWMRIRH